MVRGFIIQAFHATEGDYSKIKLYGRTEEHESFLIKHDFVPYFFVNDSDVQKVKELSNCEIQKTKFKNFNRDKVSKIIFNNQNLLVQTRKLFNENGISCFEADINPASRFLIDNNIRGSLEIVGKGIKAHNVELFFDNPEIKPSDYKPKLSILSVDIETDLQFTDIFCISLYTEYPETYKKVLIVKNPKTKEAENDAEYFDDEKAMLIAFKNIVTNLDPDVITGWNFIDFDLSVLKKRFEKYNIKFALGRDDREVRLNIQTSFFVSSRADITGRVVLDGIALLKDSFISMPDNKLNTVAKHVLGQEKLITSHDRGGEIGNLFEENHQKLVDYNLLDSKLVYDILEKLKLIELCIFRSKLTGMTLDRVGASIASFDSLYLKNLRENKIIAPSISNVQEEERITGGYVIDPKPGIYENILVFDFKSLYPSIIRTFNIDPVNFVPFHLEDKFKNFKIITAPNNAKFINNDGILPKLLKTLWEERDIAKKNNDKISANAIKITMNSMFGVLANPMCRFYNRDVANAITSFGRHIIQLTVDKIDELGYDVIYGDTDSIFVKINDATKENALEAAKQIETDFNKFYEEHVEKNYERKNVLDLEFEKMYTQFFMPTARGSSAGAKKRYAGFLEKDGEEKLSFVGLEYVRSDWTKMAKKFQYDLLYRVFKNEKIDRYIKDLIADLKAGKYDDQLVYKKSIRKPVEEYTKTTPPHIQAARKIGFTGTGQIDYVMTVDGPEATEKILHDLDYEHYIQKQIKPIADSILHFKENSFDDIIKGKQKNLFDF